LRHVAVCADGRTAGEGEVGKAEAVPRMLLFQY
jgi:hypothetical protein